MTHINLDIYRSIQSNVALKEEVLMLRLTLAVVSIVTYCLGREVEDHQPEKTLAGWLHTLKSMQSHVSLLLQTFQITWTIWQSLPTNCRDRCKPSYNPFYVHSVALIPFAKKKNDCGGSKAMNSCSPRS